MRLLTAGAFSSAVLSGLLCLHSETSWEIMFQALWCTGCVLVGCLSLIEPTKD